MGGSGGGDAGYTGSGSAGGGYASGSAGRTPCSRVSFDVHLSSPVETVLGMLRVGYVCDVIMLANPRRIAVVTRPGGQVVGAITSRWEDLIFCIDDGFSFEAELLSTNSPPLVRVRPAWGAAWT